MDYMTDAPFVPAQLHFSVTLKRESEKINSFVLCFPEWSSPSLNQKQLLVHSGKPSKPVLEFWGLGTESLPFKTHRETEIFLCSLFAFVSYIYRFRSFAF